jgi:hypothetical protein
MGLKPPSARSPHVIKDDSGHNVIVHHTDDEASFSVSVRKDKFEQFLLEQELGCLWFVFGERSAWPTGGHEDSTRRWFGSLVCFDGSTTRDFDWEMPW